MAEICLAVLETVSEALACQPDELVLVGAKYGILGHLDALQALV